MTHEDFRAAVEDFLAFGVEYADDEELIYGSDDEAGDPTATLNLEFGGDIYSVPLIVGEDGDVGINTHEYSTIDLNTESLFIWLFFEAQKRRKSLVSDLLIALERVTGRLAEDGR